VLGADSRELECLRYGVYDKPDKRSRSLQVAAYLLGRRGFGGDEGGDQETSRGEDLAGYAPAEAKKCRSMSREFIARDLDGKARSVEDLSHLSEHYDPVVTKSEGLEGFAASLLSEDTMLSMDLKCGYRHFRLHLNMRQCVSVTVMMVGGTKHFFFSTSPCRLDGVGVVTGSSASSAVSGLM
jgi:hypothetical protein